MDNDQTLYRFSLFSSVCVLFYEKTSCDLIKQKSTEQPTCNKNFTQFFFLRNKNMLYLSPYKIKSNYP